MNNLFSKMADIWRRYLVKLSIRRSRNYFRKKLKIVKKFETIALNLCETCNLISYRDQDIVQWNRSGILLVTSILITMVMMTIAIFDGFPAPMGCAPKTCFTEIILPPNKHNSHATKNFDNHHHPYDQEEIVTASRWMSSKLYLLRDR